MAVVIFFFLSMTQHLPPQHLTKPHQRLIPGRSQRMQRLPPTQAVRPVPRHPPQGWDRLHHHYPASWRRHHHPPGRLPLWLQLRFQLRRVDKLRSSRVDPEGAFGVSLHVPPPFGPNRHGQIRTVAARLLRVQQQQGGHGHGHGGRHLRRLCHLGACASEAEEGSFGGFGQRLF